MENIFSKFVGRAVDDVLATMASIQNIKHGDAYLKDPSVKTLGDISVIIGFAGETVRGTFVLHFSKPMAFLLLDKIFGSTATAVTDELLDAVGEVTNMICGKIKTDVVNAGVPEFDISVPTIIVGQDFQTHIKMNDAAVIFPCAAAEPTQTLNVELKVKKLK